VSRDHGTDISGDNTYISLSISGMYELSLCLCYVLTNIFVDGFSCFIYVVSLFISFLEMG